MYYLSVFVLTNVFIYIKPLKSQGGLGLPRFPSNFDLPLILILLLLVKIPPVEPLGDPRHDPNR